MQATLAQPQPSPLLTRALSLSIRAGVVLLLWTPLVVTPSTVWPFTVGKALYARGLIEVIVGLWVVLAVWDARYRPRFSWVTAAFAVYVGVALLSAFAGVSFAHSFWSDYQRMAGVWDLFHWLLLALAATSVLRSGEDWRTLVNWNLGVALALSLLAVAQANGMRVLPFLLPTRECRLDATLGNPTYLAGILVVAILLAVGLLAHSFSRDDGARGEGRLAATSGASTKRLLAQRAFWLATALLGLWVLFQTGTRGALVGLVAGAVAAPAALALWGNRRSVKIALLAAGGLMLGVALFFALDRASVLPGPAECHGQTTASRLSGLVAAAADEGGLNGVSQESSAGARLALVKIGLAAFRDRPLLGWGQDNFSYAFDKHAEASLYALGSASQDRAHSKVIEELSTKGVLGLASYVALVGVLVWTIVRRRRASRDEVLAYAALGAVVGYVVQDLFFFDTPATMLQWTLLVAWVASLGMAAKPQVAAVPARDKGKRGAAAPRRTSRPATARPSLAWAKALGTGLVVVVAPVILFQFGYRPYHAGQQLLQAENGPGPVKERLALAREAVATFPSLGGPERRTMFEQLNSQWKALSVDDREQVVRYVASEGEQAIAADPGNARILKAVLPIPQAAFPVEELARLDPLLQRLQELAPQRVYTYQLLAGQALRRGDFQLALHIADEFEALAPATAESFQDIRWLAAAQSTLSARP